MLGHEAVTDEDAPGEMRETYHVFADAGGDAALKAALFRT